MDILFLLKYRVSNEYNNLASSGLFNSMKFINDALFESGFNTGYVHCIDSNEIDREVHKAKPKIVILEAYWVTPNKMRELIKLHPNVKWIIRIHSNLPFFVTETIALKWTFEFITLKNVFIAANNIELYNGLLEIAENTNYYFFRKKIMFLPNYYLLDESIKKSKKIDKNQEEINIGCFGALRLLKNQMNQALASIKFANDNNLKLNFHINVSRLEGNGANGVLENIRNLFIPFSASHKLVEHTWLEHGDFKNLVRTMDLGLQVSFTETFNIVAADFVDELVPVVVSKEIDWVEKKCFADPTSVDDISKKIEEIIFAKYCLTTHKNKRNLKKFVNNSLDMWIKSMEKLIISGK